MSGVALVIPVKAVIGAKQRLSVGLGPVQRRLLAVAMAGDMVRIATSATSPERIVVVAGDDDVERMAARHRVSVVREARGAGQSAAVRAGAAWAREHGFTAVATVSADCPLARLEDVDVLLAAGARRGRFFHCVPDADGTGTNAAVLRPADADVWRFGPNSLERHREAAEAAGLRFSALDLPSLRVDCDRPADLERILDAPAPTATYQLLRSLGLARRAAG